ncbi:hypothetical protein M422DRAFT_269227 [Sphaerobolus stellatus SS14]|uniref:Uncharacterized protein n=1 Tax=Sphaerobolus stellatus (strain SS14) TaxID=990650 RepID=A0A0C9UW89_SPHS4|nr:hypothetical protein M422DRAFT_269227 [Sphaerobolus stellatus SS14]
MTHLHEHNDSEEVNDLPGLEPHLGSEGTKEAAQSFSRTNVRPNEVSSDDKTARSAAKASLGPIPPRQISHPMNPCRFLVLRIDKLRDVFSSFPNEDNKARMKAEAADL